MRKTHIIIYALLMAGIFLFSSCQEDDFGEPNGIKITFHATSFLSNSDDTVLIDDAYIGIGAIDLKREGEADSAAVEKIVYKGPYVADLINGSISPAIRWIFAEPGNYREIEVETHKALPEGKTIILKGTIIPVDGGEDIPFELITTRNYTLHIDNPSGIEVRKGKIVDLLVVFDLTDLFSGIDLNSLNKNENGVVVISEENGSGTVALLVDKFESFSSFGINNGLPLLSRNDDVPDDEFPAEDEDTGDNGDEEGGDDDSDEDTDDDSTSGEGTSDEDDEDDDSDQNDDDDNQGDEGDNQDSEDGDTDEDDGDDNQGQDDDDGSDPGTGETDEDSDAGDDDETGNSGDDSSNDNDQDDGGTNDDEDDDSDNDDGGDDDEENDENDEQDEDNDEGADDDSDSGSDDDNSDNSNEDKDKNKDKGNSGKGNKGDSGSGNKK